MRYFLTGASALVLFLGAGCVRTTGTVRETLPGERDTVQKPQEIPGVPGEQVSPPPPSASASSATESPAEKAEALPALQTTYVGSLQVVGDDRLFWHANGYFELKGNIEGMTQDTDGELITIAGTTEGQTFFVISWKRGE